MRWFGHARRKDDGYVVRRMLRMEMSGKRKREGLKGGLWMLLEWAWQSRKRRRRMQMIGPNRDGKSAT